jgi:geranylgeranyl diphosphate synthase, type III
MLQFHRGQGTEIWWRDNFVSPSEVEYRHMVMKKRGSLFVLVVRLMQLFTSIEHYRTADFHHLCQLLSLFFQIRDDYSNLLVNNDSLHKAFGEDITEGKFSFPILHAINTREGDTRLIHILKQRTVNVELKQYCIQLLHEFGSMEYTRRKCDDLAQRIYHEIDDLGGNACLENLVRQQTKMFFHKETNRVDPLNGLVQKNNIHRSVNGQHKH